MLLRINTAYVYVQCFLKKILFSVTCLYILRLFKINIVHVKTFNVNTVSMYVQCFLQKLPSRSMLNVV